MEIEGDKTREERKVESKSKEKRKNENAGKTIEEPEELDRYAQYAKERHCNKGRVTTKINIYM